MVGFMGVGFPAFLRFTGSPLVLEKAINFILENRDVLVSFSYGNSFSSEGEGSE